MDLQGFTPSQQGGEHGPEETERGEASWNEQHSFPWLDMGIWGLITDRDLCHTARAEGSGPCVLSVVEDLCSLSWSAAGLGELLPSVYSRDLTHNPESPRISALYYWKMCSRVFLRGSSLQTPSPLTVSSLLPESVKDSQDLDVNRQVVAERETLCNQKTVQKSQFCFWGRNQPAEWLRNAVAIQAIEWSTTKQRRGDSQLSVWADLQMLLEHSSGGVNGSQPRETNKIFLIGRKIGELGFPDKAKACFQLS